MAIKMRDAIFEWKSLMLMQCECGRDSMVGTDESIYEVDGQLVSCNYCGRLNRIRSDDFCTLHFDIERDGDHLPMGLHFDKKVEFTSYIDNTMRYIFFTPKHQFIDTEDPRIGNMQKRAYLEMLVDRIPSIIKHGHNKPLLHEFHHGFQTVFYPFLYLQSWLEQKTIMLCGSFLRSENRDIHIDGITLPEEYMGTLSFQWERARLILNGPNDFRIIPHPKTEEYVDDVSLIDLLENATSLFEYRFIAGQNHSPQEFCKWLEQNVRYQNVFKMLAGLIGVDAAYHCLPVITLVSFHTTYPLGAFWSLANFIVVNELHIGELEDIDTLHDILMHAIQREPFFEVKDIVAEPPLKRIPKTTITFDSYQSIVNQTPFHTAFNMAKNYLQEVRKDGDFPKLLYHPELEENVRRIVNSVPPPVTIVNLKPPYLHNVDRVVFIDEAYAMTPYPAGNNLKYADMAFELLHQKDFFWNILTHSLNEEMHHRCQHKDCEYFPTGLCSFWVPTHSKSECAFPEWVYTNYKKRINTKRRMFIA